MKFITKSAAYIELSDIKVLLKNNVNVPKSILEKSFISDKNYVRCINAEEIDFIKNCKWVLDYTHVNNLSENEICMFGDNICSARNKIVVDAYYNLDILELELFDEGLNDGLFQNIVSSINKCRVMAMMGKDIILPNEIVNNNEEIVQSDIVLDDFSDLEERLNSCIKMSRAKYRTYSLNNDKKGIFKLVKSIFKK